MKIVENSVERIEFDIRGKKMEYCGRICYKSDSNINDTSYIKFLTNIYKSGHTSVLEHERVIFKSDSVVLPKDNKYFVSTYINGNYYISANVRAWLNSTNKESIFYPYLKELYPFLFTEEPVCAKSSKTKVIDGKDVPVECRDLHDAKTFKIIASRGCTHQLVRHRVFSFSQQSQRYCNFSGDKFGHSIDFIMPIINDVKEFTEDQMEEAKVYMAKSFENSENEYFDLIEKYGLRPEDARNVLPNAAASIIVMTGTVKQWQDFFALRCDSHAQREIRDIANKIKEILNDEKTN